MIKVLVELLLVAVMFGSVQGSGAMPPEVEREVAARLPVVAANYIPLANASERITGLPVIEDREVWPQRLDPESLGVAVTAASAIVVDRDSGAVLFEKNPDAVRAIASLTKLMTALVVLEQTPNLDAEVVIIAEDQVPATSTIFRIGDRVSMRDLLFASMIGSANDAARALARASGLARETFVARMNEMAGELGMPNTRFVEPTGLDARNVSTAREVSKLIDAARAIPILREATQTPVYRTRGSTQKSQFVRSTDLLLSSFINEAPYRIALAKTGSLAEAGFCFGSTVEEAEHGVTVVVLGSQDHFSRFDDAKALAYWALTTWEWAQ